MERADIHGYRARVDNALAKIQESDLSDKNKIIMEKFYKFSVAQQITDGRIAKHLWHLFSIARIVRKDFDDVNRDDIENILVELQRRKLKESTIRDYKIVLKKFYNWLRKYPRKQYPPEVSWLSTAGNDEGTRDPSSDLSLDDIKRLARAAEHPRDKAFVWMLYETGARVGEILNVRLKHLSFGQVCTVKIWGEKVKRWRELPLVDSRADLATWLDVHPQNGNPESYLWISVGTRNHGELMSYPNTTKLLQKMSSKAGITKPVNPHSFRHSRLSFLGDFLTEAQLCDFAGWRLGSGMARIYVRPKRTKQAILGVYGIKIDAEEQKAELTPKNCTICTMLNSPESKYCRHCGTVLDLRTAVDMLNQKEEYEKVQENLYSKPEMIKQAVTSLQQNDAIVKQLKEMYPKYFELAQKAVAKELRNHR